MFNIHLSTKVAHTFASSLATIFNDPKFLDTVEDDLYWGVGKPDLSKLSNLLPDHVLGKVDITLQSGDMYESFKGGYTYVVIYNQRAFIVKYDSGVKVLNMNTGVIKPRTRKELRGIKFDWFISIPTKDLVRDRAETIRVDSFKVDLTDNSEDTDYGLTITDPELAHTILRNDPSRVSDRSDNSLVYAPVYKFNRLNGTVVTLQILDGVTAK